MPRYTPRPHFRAFHERKQRWSVLVCHRRAGKTFACVNDVIGRGLMTPMPHAQYAYIAPFREQAKRVAWPYLTRFTEGMRSEMNIAELSVVLHNGSKIFLFGGDNPDALRGLYFDGVVIDEPAQMRENLFREVIRPALADRHGWAVFIGTPQGKSNDFWRIHETARQNPVEYYLLTLRASESGILPQRELDDMRKLLDEDEYAQEMECSFDAALKGSYYGKILNSMGERLGDVPHDPSLPVHIVLDLGYTDTTAGWAWQALGTEIRVVWGYQAAGWEIADHIDHLRTKPFMWGDFWVPHDAKAKSLQTGRSLIELLVKDHGVRPLLVPSLSVQQGIQAGRRLLGECYIDADECSEGVEMLRQYQREYDDMARCFKQNPKHDLASNYADAWRYLSLVAHRGAREGANRIAPLNGRPAYDPSLPFGGQLKLGNPDEWQGDWSVNAANDRNERI